MRSLELLLRNSPAKRVNRVGSAQDDTLSTRLHDAGSKKTVTPPAASQGATGYTLGGASVGDVSPIGAQRVIYRTPTGTNAFDGRWSVVIHTRAGSCGAEYRYGVQIINGNIVTDAGDSTGVSGRVLRNGAVSVSVSAGDAYAVGQGRLSPTYGSGTWRGESSGESCTGVWQAARRG